MEKSEHVTLFVGDGKGKTKFGDEPIEPKPTTKRKKR